MDTHTIRLGDAWEPAGPDGSWTRRFGRPGGLGPRDRVLLVVVRPAAAAASLNDTPLPALPADGRRWQHDVTALLRERNVLILKPAATPFAATSPRPGVRGRLSAELGEVSLEIVADSE